MNGNEPLESRITDYDHVSNSGASMLYFNVKGPVSASEVKDFLQRRTVQPVNEHSLDTIGDVVIYNDHGAVMQFSPTEYNS